MDRRIVIMAGGTGGHVFPALAVAHCLRERGYAVSWIGTEHGIEARVVPAAGFELDRLAITGVRGKGVLTRLAAPFMLLQACSQAARILIRRKPAVVLGMGGFAAGPGGLMAWLLRIPLVVHEQNRIPGSTNRYLARIAQRVLEAFQGSFAPQLNAEHTGNPLNRDIVEWARRPENQRHGTHRPVRLLVVGGSLGASILNESVPGVCARLSEQPTVWHQTGAAMFETVQEEYAERGLSARVDAFIDGMAEAYQWADLVLCRAGAMTVSELTAVGRASVLVPYPYAVDDHQTYNARYLADAGAAVLIPQSDLSADYLTRVVQGLISEPEAIIGMAKKAARLARPDATETVASVCQEAGGVHAPV